MKRLPLLPPLVLFIIFFSLYLYTMSPTVYWQDAGIYLTGLKIGGNVYPPGFPLYMVLGRIWTQLLPTDLFTLKVHAFSALFAALSSVIGFQIVYELTKNKITLFKKKEPAQQTEHERESTEENHSALLWSTISSSIAGIVTALLIGLNYNLWAQAINAEVYALHTFFYLIIVYLIVILGKKGKIEKILDPIQQKLIIAISIVYGLSYGNHPMTVVLLPVFIFLIFSQKNIFYHPKLVITALLLFIISGFSFYSYLPLTANTHPILNWGNPNSINRFIDHVTAKTYITNDQSFVFNDITRYQAAWQEFVWEFGYAGIAIAIIGFIIIAKRDKNLSIIFAVVMLFHTIFAIFYKQTTEYNSWLIPAHTILAMLIGYTIYIVLTETKPNFKSKHYIFSSVSIAALVLFIVFIVPHWSANYRELNRREYYYAEDFGTNILKNLDPNSLIIMTGDQESSTVMYLQTVKKFRTDVIAFKNIEADELLYPEGRAEIKSRYPTLIVPDETTQLSNDPGVYLNQLIDANSPTRSVYLMSKNIFPLNTDKYSLVPAAAMYKVVPVGCTKCTIELKYWNFSYHDPHYYLKQERPLMSLKDPSAPGGVKRVPYIEHMINFELQSWKNLGDIYLELGQCKQATESYNKMSIIKKDIFTMLPQIPNNIASCKDKS